MDIYILSADFTKDYSEYEKYIPLLSSLRREKLESLKRKEDKIICILSELFMRKIISDKTSIPFFDVKILYSENGKPYINMPDFHFSMSHSRNLIAFVWDTSPIGIDLEYIQDRNVFPAMRFYTENEADYVNSAPDKKRAFFEIWTKKEAYIKMLGTGLKTPLSSFDVTVSPTGFFSSTNVPENFIVSLCSKANEKPITKVFFTLEKDFRL